MKSRIYRAMMLLSAIGIVIVSIALCIVFYGQISSQVRGDLREWTEMFQDDNSESALADVHNNRPDSIRVTLVHPDGRVGFDNTVSAEGMGNHLDREEIREAIAYGTGESSRYSDTIGERTYYSAVRLTDGSVLRAAKTINSIWAVFARATPAIIGSILASLIVSYLLAGRLAKRIISPMLAADPETSAVPYDELAPYARAIAEHREQIASDQTRIQQRTETIDAILENMEEGVVLFDQDRDILSINRSAERIFGLQRSMRGRNAIELLRDIDFSSQIQNAVLGTKSEMTYRRQDRDYRLLISPVTDVGVIVFFLDVTERMESDRLRREFSANVSHELRTPLTSIYGHAEMLREDLINEADKPEFYDKIVDEAARLIELVEDIMLLSSLDEKRILGQLEEVSVAELADECRASLEQQATEQQVSVAIKGDAQLRANRSLLHDLLYNLIGNAIKYNRPAGTVEIEMSQDAGQVFISVADTGIGIAEQDQKRIFERFYRADKSRSKKTGGTGLGLAIVKHIVLVHDGKIDVKSKENEGTQFTILLPKVSD